MTALLLAFGSRTGSAFALVFFGPLFGVIGWLAARQLGRRWPQGWPSFARVVGLLLFIVPVSLLYASSLNGFYELEVSAGELRLRYLMPGDVTVLSHADVTRVEAVPAFKGRWRLHVVAADRRYVSATWHREPVTVAVEQLRSLGIH